MTASHLVKQTATVKTPSGLALTMGRSHTVTLADPKNPLSLLTRTDTTSFNGKTFTHTFDVTSRQSTIRSPLGRSRSAMLNAQGRTSSLSAPGITSIGFTYDASGRLTQSTQGAHSVGYTAEMSWM
ncbi:MAG TPA: hypothetical protein VJ901_10780 [Thermoanaerobaculia bacterium]|jgi:YD repeat-containing protein|nr:hypothetical protein [Thermoanaerobaculia bacterium]